MLDFKQCKNLLSNHCCHSNGSKGKDHIDTFIEQEDGTVVCKKMW